MMSLSRLALPATFLFLVVTMMLLFSKCAGGLNGWMTKPSPIYERSRVRSPDGALEAVEVERGSHSTVATPTEVYIVPVGASVSGEPLLLADHVKDLVFTWIQSDQLQIDIGQARLFRRKAAQRVWSPGSPNHRDVSVKIRVREIYH